MIHPNELGILKGRDTMVVGIDVSHPPPKGMENSPSIVGMVASVDDSFAKWPGSFRIQEGRQEIQKRRRVQQRDTGGSEMPEDKEDMVYNIETLMGERLSAFEQMNRRLPKNILIYRDGESLRLHGRTMSHAHK